VNIHLALPPLVAILALQTGCTSNSDTPASKKEDAPKAMPALDAGPDPKSAPYRGYEAMDGILRARLVAKPTSFSLTSYLDDPGADAGAGSGAQLAVLLGAWSGIGTTNALQNGDPNAMSFLIWRIAFSGLGKDVASTCPDAAGALTVHDFELRPELARIVQRLCTWPQSSAREDDTLRAFWQGMTRYDAPPGEYDAWKAHFMGPAYASTGPDVVIPLMVMSALLNPYVLLQP